jgi:hypothetical protein
MELTAIECVGGWVVVYAPAGLQWVTAMTVPDSPTACYLMIAVAGWD